MCRHLGEVGDLKKEKIEALRLPEPIKGACQFEEIEALKKEIIEALMFPKHSIRSEEKMRYFETLKELYSEIALGLIYTTSGPITTVQAMEEWNDVILSRPARINHWVVEYQLSNSDDWVKTTHSTLPVQPK